MFALQCRVCCACCCCCCFFDDPLSPILLFSLSFYFFSLYMVLFLSVIRSRSSLFPVYVLGLTFFFCLHAYACIFSIEKNLPGLFFSGVRLVPLHYIKNKKQYLGKQLHIVHKWQGFKTVNWFKHFNWINYMKIIQRHYVIVTNVLNRYYKKWPYKSIQYIYIFKYINII